MDSGFFPESTRLGRYQIVKRLGGGDASEVLLAVSHGPHGFERIVVLKRLLPEYESDPSIGRMLATDPPDVMDVHAYPTSACSAPLTTAARLLAKHASVGLVEKYGWLLRVARAAHRPAIISESNSASCGGKPGVSNTPVASVWAARYVVAALLAGFAQVRFHSAGGSYDPLVFNADGTITMRPLGHALLFLHRWIPVGSRIESNSGDPRVLAATIAEGAETSVIVSSFSSKPLSFSINVPGAATNLPTDTLTTSSAIEEPGSVAVAAHRAQLVLAPDTVVAVKTG